MSTLFHTLRLLLVFLAAIGVVLHATVRDSVPLVSVLFYALPLPAVAGLLFGAAVLGLRRPAWFMITLAAALLVLGVWLGRTYGTNSPSAGDVRIGTWNIARPRHPLPALIDLVKRENPDFLALVESGAMNTEIAREYERALPGYHCVLFPGGISCLSRNPVLSSQWHSIVDGGQGVSVETTLGGTPVRILILDLSANVFLMRAAEFGATESLAGKAPRTIVLGDFNTPLESIFCDGLRKTFINSMDAAGIGFRETWFFGLPLLSLDHVWTSRDLPPVDSRRLLTWASDHAPVIVGLRIAPLPTAESSDIQGRP